MKAEFTIHTHQEDVFIVEEGDSYCTATMMAKVCCALLKNHREDAKRLTITTPEEDKELNDIIETLEYIAKGDAFFAGDNFKKHQENLEKFGKLFTTFWT